MSREYIDYLKSKLEDSFDVKFREIQVNEGKIYAVFIDNLSDKSFISEYIILPLIQSEKYVDIDSVKREILNANIVGDVESKEDAIMHILSGDLVLVFDFWDAVIFCEAKSFPKRGISDPKTENVIKGPQEGFNEVVVDNIALIRKRVKNENLRFESMIVGKKSNTTVVLAYIKGIAPDRLVGYIRDKINSMEEDFILDINYIEERLKSKGTIFDTIGYTERPDKAASRLFEGRVVVIVDGTPEVITAPYFFIENLMAADDYYSNKYFANAVRIQRWVAFFLATFLPGLYIALTTYHFSLVPTVFVFRFAIARAGVPFPTIVEVILMTFFFQLLREAGVRLPEPTGQTMSIVGALILGDAAVGAGLASQITIVIVSIASISTFLIPSLYRPISLWGLIILLFSALLGLPGFYMGFFTFIAHISSLTSCGYPFLYPLGTLESFKYKDEILRSDLNKISNNLFDRDDKI
ncbi:MAG: spore germination protein [Clostridium sp.]|nr:spore germination protein [Clostridium sp.]